MKRQPQSRQTRPLQRPGRPEHARPCRAQVQLVTQLQHLGVVSAAVRSAAGRQPLEPSGPQLAGPEIEP